MMNIKVDFPHPTPLPSQPSTNESSMFSLGDDYWEKHLLPKQDYWGPPPSPAWPPVTTTPPPTTTPPTTTPPTPQTWPGTEPPKAWPETEPPKAWPETEPPKAWDYGYHGASSITMNRY